MMSNVARKGNLTFNKMSQVLLNGIYDPDCLFSMLRGCPHVLKMIWRLMLTHWKTVIKFPVVYREEDYRYIVLYNYYDVMESYSTVGFPWSHAEAFFLAAIYRRQMIDSNSYYENRSHFPNQSIININMMPFVLERTFEDCKLPEFVKPYWKMMELIIIPEWKKHHSGSRNKTEVVEICYLSIQEDIVEKGKSQRRPGFHIDNPGEIKIQNSVMNDCKEGSGHINPLSIQDSMGIFPGAHFVYSESGGEKDVSSVVITGGIYMASSRPNSCIAWDCKVVPDIGGQEVIGHLGDVEHLRHLLPPGQVLKENQLYWITDRTPHESLPLPDGGPSQFFRLVTSQVSLWYRDHSTPNPLGVEPNPKITKIVRGDKFSSEGVEVEYNI